MRISILFVLLFCGFKLLAQSDSVHVKHDTAYYERYTEKLTVTPYLVKNLTAFTLSSNNTGLAEIPYYSNSPGGVGLRLGYDWFSVGGAYSVGFFDPEYKKGRGKTKAINLSTSFLARNFMVDVYLQQYKSFFLRSDALPIYNTDPYYVRPDIKVGMVGATGSYVFNGKKFSARDAFKLDTRQKKSAGSFIAGLEWVMGKMQSDSAFLPLEYQFSDNRYRINKLQYTVIGPNVGYGYTFVIKRNFFVNAVATLNADAAYTKASIAHSDLNYKDWSFTPSLNVRGGLGYNKPDWAIAFSYYTKRIYFGKSNAPLSGVYNNDYRLSYTRRINAGRRIPRIINWAGRIIEDLGFGFLIR